MRDLFIQLRLVLLTLLCGAMSVASAANRFYLEPVNIEPGESRQLCFVLENSQEFYGFQADIDLPHGLEFVDNNGKADFTLSARADASYSTVSNLLAENSLRVGAFSSTHAAITGNEGTLLYATVRASSEFAGGLLKISNVLFVSAADNDVALPDFSAEIGVKHDDRFYIPEFNISVGEIKTISLVLDNETPFTAFQTDLYLPEGMSIVANSMKLTSRCSANHSVTAKSFSDGWTRLICMSLANEIFTGNKGPLLEIDVKVDREVTDTAVMEMKNQIFSMANAREYKIPDTKTEVVIEGASVTNIVLNRVSASLKVSETLNLVATISPEYASDKSINWTSSNSSIANVDSNGMVSAISIGTATITARSVSNTNVAGSCQITVLPTAVSKINLNQNSVSLKVGETFAFAATVLPETATDKGIRWVSEDIRIASINENGVVTAKALGSVQINALAADDSGVTATAVVNVIETPAESIAIQKPAMIELKAGETISLKAIVLPENASDKSVMWTSSDSDIATVNSIGVVTAVNVGKVVITDTNSAGISDDIELSVIPTLAEGISLKPDEMMLKVNETRTISVILVPSTTTDQSVRFISSDSSVAIVDEVGNVTALSLGEAIITATTNDGSDLSANCKVLVSATPTSSISILYSGSTSLQVGQTVQLTAKILPVDATDVSVKWSTQDSKIITVDDKGLVRAISFGEAWVSVQASGGQMDRITFNVVPTLAESIKIDQPEMIEMITGDNYQLTATVLPESATDKTVIWESSDTMVVSVSDDGIVTANAAGNCVVTARTADGSNLTDECHISVFKDSGIDTVLIDDIKINVLSRSVYIEGVPIGTYVRLYDFQGKLIAIEKGKTHPIKFEITPNTIYILCVSGYSIKILGK